MDRWLKEWGVFLLSWCILIAIGVGMASIALILIINSGANKCAS